MKLSAGQISGFLQKPPSSVRAVLFYGPDAGLVRERAEQMAGRLVSDKSDPFAVTTLTGDGLKDDPARLYDEAASMALGGGRRLVRVQQALDSNAAALSRFLDDPPPGDSLILLEAGDLEKRSKLRALCEGETPLAAAIPCYVEDAAARQRTVAGMLEAENLTIGREALRFLCDILPPDRLALRSEVEKLAMYALGKGSVTIEDVRAVIADAGGAEIDDLVQAALNGDVANAARLLDHLFAEQTSPVAIFRALQRHLMRLQLARAYMDERGLGASEAIKKLSPPVFWKMVEPMTRQLHRWTAPRIQARLDQLLEAEAAVKRTGTPDIALCAQLVTMIAAKG